MKALKKLIDRIAEAEQLKDKIRKLAIKQAKDKKEIAINLNFINNGCK